MNMGQAKDWYWPQAIPKTAYWKCPAVNPVIPFRAIIGISKQFWQEGKIAPYMPGKIHHTLHFMPK